MTGLIGVQVRERLGIQSDSVLGSVYRLLQSLNSALPRYMYVHRYLNLLRVPKLRPSPQHTTTKSPSVPAKTKSKCLNNPGSKRHGNQIRHGQAFQLCTIHSLIDNSALVYYNRGPEF